MFRSPIDAAAWEPQPPPPIEATHDLSEMRLIGDGRLPGPEDIAVDAQGRLYTGCDDHRIYRLNPDGSGVFAFATTRGRPLGLCFDDEGFLLVANHPLGIQRIDPQCRVSLVTARADALPPDGDGSPVRFANSLLIDTAGGILFTDSSTRFHAGNGYDAPHGVFDMLEARPHGRLLRYDPATRRTSILLRDLYFPNGITLSSAGDELFIAETFRYRVLRYDLVRGGEPTVFLDNLPGYPDGIRRDPATNLLYVVMGVKRSPLGDWLQPRPRLKNLVASLPRRFLSNNEPEGIVYVVDESGGIRAVLHDTKRTLHTLTNALPHEGRLYLGALRDRHLGVIQLPSELQ